MMSPPGKQAIGTLILPSISRSKGSQTLKFGQSTEDNMRNIFLEKSNTKCGGEFISRPFSKKSKLKHIPGSIVKGFIQFVFIVAKLRAISKY